MANKNVELMRGKPEVAVKKLAIPIMISMLLTASYNIIDGIWVVGLGQVAIAGIGFVNPIFMILVGVSMGLGSGATSSISRFIGANNHEGANQSAIHSIVILAVASILLTIILLAIQKPLLILYGASGQSLVEALNYGTPLFLGLFGFMFANGASGILRGEGDMKRAMYAMIISVGLNTVLDPIFIYVMNLGSAGASLATVISSLISAVVIMYWILIKKDTYVDVNLKDFKLDIDITKDILKVGIPASMDIIFLSVALSMYLVFISMISGDYGVAAFSSGQRLYFFAIMPLSAIGTAVTAVTGSSFGARNGDYLSRSHSYGSKFSILFGTVLTIIFVVFAVPLATIFAYTPETSSLIPEIANFLRVATLCLPLTGAGMASSYFYQGIGQGSISLIWTIIREILCTNCLIYLLAILFGLGLTGVWLGLAVGRALAGALNYVYARHTINKIRKEFKN
ncbi:MAG: MATE family efflux transporter [Methanosphaera sp. rholeuAM6]|nr:MAG: MATE family efflux transporter [Methanosphaera sp. rholeuAM6]